MVRISKVYQYPGHADRLFVRIVREHLSRGLSLCRVDKGYFLGNGITLRFEFSEQSEQADYKMVHYYGRRRRPDADEAFRGWTVFAVLPMRAWWVTIGYFYVLRRACETPPSNNSLQATAAAPASCD
jgi:hypothetical protein